MASCAPIGSPVSTISIALKEQYSTYLSIKLLFIYLFFNTKLQTNLFNTSYSYLDLPMALGSLCVPPAPGSVPRLISGCPNLAFSPA